MSISDMSASHPVHHHSVLARWWHSRLPTREAIVVTAVLAFLFGCAYLAAFFVRAELLLRPSDGPAIISTIGIVVALKTLRHSTSSGRRLKAGCRSRAAS